jgi:NAD-dependent dihydropyrimidine dehydrogenase PreA subunit
MPYVISDVCATSKDRSCVDVCPVDCIYEAGDQLYIHPTECIECGACEPECPVEAISFSDSDDDFERARTFFFEVLPGRDAPLGSPGGAAELGVVDTQP